MQDIQEIIERALPGVFGSAGALFWLKGGPIRKLGLFLFGVIVAYYVGTALAQWAGVNEAATGLVLGLFSMSIVDRLFDAIQQFDFNDLFDRIVDKFLGRR
ncbi:hypothetical protein [Paracandidimonas lactea]|uniref:hypothetical protein n=1 Tax=Paracandidimonas lactea TaxID=2895524 RepID=UPI001F317FC7|nr:hypothetical protein [Paracandidimonas lactea]